jgi:hypothetical protein
MSVSLFRRLYSYRERPEKNSKENFLIEAFSFCLEQDQKFYRSFLNLVGVGFEEIAEITTQSVYDEGRPDIELNLKGANVCMLVECKIEHTERDNQLEDYGKILLKKEAVFKHLVYLTKYYDYKEIENKKYHFHQIRWVDIFDIIDDKNETITLQFKQYLKEEGMSESNNFNYHELALLNSITSLISKMNEVLDNIKPYFEKNVAKLSKDSARSTRLEEGRYINTQYFNIEGVMSYAYNVGFFDFAHDPLVAIAVYLPDNEKTKNFIRLKKLCEKTLSSKVWHIQPYQGGATFWHSKSLASFIVEEDDQIPAMINFLKKGVDDLSLLKIELNKDGF